MKKRTVAIYPGSFNPFHEGHAEIVSKALEVFDTVIVAKGVNGDKYDPMQVWDIKIPKGAIFMEYTSTTAKFAKQVHATCVIRGLRNSKDLEDEMTLQEWNKELGLEIPTFYVIASPKVRHVSSTAVRMVKKLKKDNL
jgi:pantetheine-phosphate adenylyltransferase